MPHHKSDQIKIKQQNEYSDQKDKDRRNGTFKKREKRPPKKITETYLHNSGLYYLERFAASKNHFKFVMKRKVRRSCMHHKEQNYEGCASLVDALADKFERLGLLDDTVYTNGLVASLRRKGLSRNAILRKMSIKGIAQEKTIETLEKLDGDLNETPEEAEKKAAIKLARKKRIGPYFVGEEQNIKKSLGIFARAGFSYHIAQSVLKIEHEELEDFLT